MNGLKIISGGQTGADLAGLWAAKIFGLPTGGMAPKGWKTQLGAKPELATLFGLEESESGYHGRTLQNCEKSDYTMIFASNIRSPGTKLTLHHCVRNKIHCEVFPFSDDSFEQTLTHPRVMISLKMQIAKGLHVINIAGNSTSTSARTFTFTFLELCNAFEELGFQSPILLSHDVNKVEAILRDNYDEAAYKNLLLGTT